MRIARLLALVRCLILGHVDREIRGARRLHLRCDECGRESPGWFLVDTPPFGH
jgi:hypothetical protein